MVVSQRYLASIATLEALRKEGVHALSRRKTVDLVGWYKLLGSELMGQILHLIFDHTVAYRDMPLLTCESS